MKAYVFALGLPLVLMACGGKKNDTQTNQDTTKTTLQYFGDTITEDNAIKSTELMSFMNNKDSAQVKFTTTIKEVCQKKGCWMDVEVANGELMTVRFKDYGFFVPKDAAGKTTVLNGWCYRTVESVDWLKHKAKDANKSQTEIDAITEPDTTYTFMADGVIIK